MGGVGQNTFALSVLNVDAFEAVWLGPHDLSKNTEWKYTVLQMMQTQKIFSFLASNIVWEDL